MWHAGWRIAHAGVVPDALTAVRTLAEFRSRIDADPESFLVAGPVGNPDGMVRIVGDEIDQFYLARHLHGSGVALALMAAAEAELRDRGVRDAHLICSVGNDRAFRFYRKAGWIDRPPCPATVDTSQGPMTLDVWRFDKQLDSRSTESSQAR